MKPWKRAFPDDVCQGNSWLQWGHGDEAVEESDKPKIKRPRKPLQWGHGDEAVEEIQGWRDSRWPIPLQWGHGDEAVEEVRAGFICIAIDRASMGPRR